MYGPHVPLLTYAREAAEQRGALTRVVHWPGHPAPVILDENVVSLVHDNTRAALAQLRHEAPDARIVVIAKSLGTVAAPVVADEGLAAVWLTPVLTAAIDGIDPSVVVDGLGRASAPRLLVGGSEDELWDPALARSLSEHVLDVEGADHGLMVPGPLTRSAVVLGRVAAAIEDFLDRTVWTR